VELARAALRLEKHYGTALDIEWAICPQGRVHLLQCRPLRQIKAAGAEQAAPSILAGAHALVSGGVTASSGVAAGPVYWVRMDRDALQFPEGAVLVVAQSLPRYAALLSSAGAVVAAQGGVAGHLANVAREFEVPALFGLEGLEDKLVDGQTVTVDADGLAVYEGRVEQLLAKAEHKTNLMAGSPVHQTLVKVMAFIAPLTLIDPDAAAFQPAGCQTLHDLTRFCHEKSVHEMFSFGKNHHFSERSSKQLYYRVPMQWWVINLDDGLLDDDAGKYVRLENIACVPMLALWEGMIAVPWEGPPPVDARGFASILFQATTNQALVTTVKSSYANRNYFMISKNFMSLYSRFGFHFSTIETLVSERASENYVSFSFKGGAANFERKLARVHFVAELLEEYGFRVNIKEDAAFARLEGLAEEAMKDQLKMLGYLIIHTRQLDMVMSQPAAVAHFRTKMRKDLRDVLGVRSLLDSQPLAAAVQDQAQAAASA
jgi:pyruvate,water dikinase